MTAITVISQDPPQPPSPPPRPGPVSSPPTAAADTRRTDVLADEVT